MQTFDGGTYSVVFPDASDVVSIPSTLSVLDGAGSSARLVNLSTRGRCLTGERVMIPGFYIAGTGTKRLLIRAVGPSLQGKPFNLQGVLPNPRMRLMRWNGSSYDEYFANNDWGTAPNLAELVQTAAEVYAFPLQADSRDAAMLVDLPPGQYSVLADGAGETGIAVVELYDADDDGGSSRLVNISTRGYVGVGDSILIPGFVVSHEGPKTVLIRAVGPSLARLGVTDVLADPTLAVYQHGYSSSEPILTNDDWNIGADAQRTQDVAAQLSAFALREDSADAAMVVTLKPGIYTIHARGVDGTSGVGLVEVYLLP